MTIFIITFICFLTLSLSSQEHHHSKQKKQYKKHTNTQDLGAIIYLVNTRKDFLTTRGDRKCGLNSSLTMLEANFLKRYPYPIILMNTRTWGVDELKMVRRNWRNLDISFVNIQTYFNMHSESDVFDDNNKPLSNINYKRMCSFFFSGFLNVPLLQKYRYLMRLDDDTCILDHINFDLFHEMYSNNIYYAYQALLYDPAAVVKGLRPHVSNYIVYNNITVANPSLYDKIMSRKTNVYPSFSTNLEVIDTWRYRQADIAHFLQNITDSNLIFHRRWGDAPLRMVIAQLFWGPSEVMRLCEFDYQHSSWRAKDMCEARSTDNPIFRMI